MKEKERIVEFKVTTPTEKEIKNTKEYKAFLEKVKSMTNIERVTEK